MISPEQLVCPVCCLQYTSSQMHSLTDCTHKCCQRCCFQHIQSRVTSFQPINCIDPLCSKILNKNSYIYNKLPPPLKIKIAKYQQFIIIQSNKNLKPCSNGQCLGILNILKNLDKNSKQLQCPQCKGKHCSKCFKLSHQNLDLCNQTSLIKIKNEDQTMRKLNYRRCPHCQVWVERNGGCQYLKCKCKTQFCFVCGQKFQNDSCRKQGLMTNEKIIRNLSTIGLWKKIKMPQQLKQYIIFVPKSLLQIILVLLFTIIGGTLLMSLIFAILIPLLYLAAPAALIVLYGQMQISFTLSLVLRIMTVLLYPLVGLVVSVAMLFIFITYPVMRIVYQTHFYDQIDKFMSSVTILYLTGIACIINL